MLPLALLFPSVAVAALGQVRRLNCFEFTDPFLLNSKTTIPRQGLISNQTFSDQDSISKLGELADVNLSLDPLTNVKVAKGPRYFKTMKAVGCICKSCLCCIVDPFPAQVTPAEAFLYFQHDLDHNPHNCHTLLCRLHHHGDVDLQEEEEGDCLPR